MMLHRHFDEKKAAMTQTAVSVPERQEPVEAEHAEEQAPVKEPVKRSGRSTKKAK